MFIYLDYAATTPVDPRVALKMHSCLTLEGVFANPASTHVLGRQAREWVEMAREQVGALIGASADEIIWTSGATESNNLALQGVANLYQRKGKHIVTMKTEHKAVLDTCQYLEKHGFELTYLSPDANGVLPIKALAAALRDDTILVSIMHVNNETGVIQDIHSIAALTSSRGILLHVDAAQSAGKLPIDVRQTPVDLISISAHKLYGPKGIGALYLRKKPRVRVEPLIHGGGHERGMRSGTLATHQIVGMGEACALAQVHMQRDNVHVQAMRDRLIAKLGALSMFKVNFPDAATYPAILSASFTGMSADKLLAQLPHLCISTASACMAQGGEASYVLRAMGYHDEQIKSAVRFSFGRFTKEEEIDQVADWIKAL